MNIKPKEIYVNLPIALTFDDADGILAFASNINTIIHGKVKVKCENLGSLGGKHVGVFYLQRNGEYQHVREQFLELIEKEEMETKVEVDATKSLSAKLKLWEENDMPYLV